MVIKGDFYTRKAKALRHLDKIARQVIKEGKTLDYDAVVYELQTTFGVPEKAIKDRLTMLEEREGLRVHYGLDEESFGISGVTSHEEGGE